METQSDIPEQDSARRDRGVVLLTGATGYIGGRLAPHLLDAGWRVRCVTRSEAKLRSRSWTQREGVEIVEADAANENALREAMRGCDAAYYLVHSMMAAGASYRDRDRELASIFARAASEAGLPRIIYLGGLGETGEDLSQHLSSRQEVERALASGAAALTTLRAAMIIGSGSASFEILRYLVERLPVMVTPRWVKTESQPIGVRNVLHYLVQCLDVEETTGKTLDIGGPDVVTYRELMRIMAEERGLARRLVIPVPVLTPRLSSLWIHLVTPMSARIARPLAEGLRNRVVCRDIEAQRLMPQRLLTAREAIAAALGKVEGREVESSWSDAGRLPGDPDWAGGTVFTDARETIVGAGRDETFHAVCGLGGEHGYFTANWLWRLRGLMDKLIGGPGLRRGRRHPDEISYGDALDFWRVTKIETNREIELRAEMRLPGVATLSFEIDERGPGQVTLRQIARFKPKGLLGILYWYSVLPLHGIVFRGMLQGIQREAERLESPSANAAA